jgi:hypothetical protein
LHILSGGIPHDLQLSYEGSNNQNEILEIFSTAEILIFELYETEDDFHFSSGWFSYVSLFWMLLFK